MNPCTAVIIATKGRPWAISNILDTLALQTVLPDVIVVSASDPSDINQSNCDALNVQTVFGPPGLTAQRNRALSLVRGKCDIVIFFDDDFIPSRFWIERIQMLLATQSDVGCVTGRVLLDGALVGELDWSDGQSMVNKADASMKMVTMDSHNTKDDSPYGCNMAFRSKIIEHLKFDERLVLYGWLEDRDFGFRAAAGGRTISTDLVWGVHLGTNRGRISGFRFGYSQIVNPWYLMKKGSMKPFDACRCIVRWLSSNALGVIFQNSAIDRWGRLKGNIVGIKDIMFGHWAPERITEL
jgi:glycosyltransferase involved in cell wall biosynthesis